MYFVKTYEHFTLKLLEKREKTERDQEKENKRQDIGLHCFKKKTEEQKH